MKQTRNTRQRLLILRIMKDNRSHPTADEVYEAARRIEPRISRGTVYNNLNLLADRGEIHRLAMTKGPDHYDCNTSHHYHFICRKCDRVFDTPIPYNASLNLTPKGMKGFRTEYHRMLLVGLCPECAAAENPQPQDH